MLPPFPARPRQTVSPAGRPAAWRRGGGAEGRRGGGTFSTGARTRVDPGPARSPDLRRSDTKGRRARPRTPSKCAVSTGPRERCPSPPAARWRPVAPGAGPESEQRTADGGGGGVGCGEGSTQGAGRRRGGLPGRALRQAAAPTSPRDGCFSRTDAVSTADGWTPLRPETDLGARRPKPPAIPAVRPTRGETGTSFLVTGGTAAARGTDCPGMRAFVLGRGRVALGPAAFLWVDSVAGSVQRSRAPPLGSFRSGRGLITAS